MAKTTRTNMAWIIIAVVLVVGYFIITQSETTQDPPPTTMNFPITTWEESEEYGVEMFGDAWVCEEPDDGTLGLMSGDIASDESGYYGWRVISTDGIHGFTITHECLRILEYDDQGRPKSGVTLIDFEFDPNNGWIKEFQCNSERLDNCPQDSEGNFIRVSRMWEENPDYETYRALPHP